MTKTAQHSLWFRLWVRIRGLLAVVIILFGILVALVSLILPNEDLYKQYVINFLQDQWDKEVEIGEISGKWHGLGPIFIINNLVIKDTDEVVIQQATLYINVIKYLIPKGSTGIRLGISDISVDFERKPTGQIVLNHKKKKQQSFSQKLEKILATGSLSIDNLSLNLYDSANQSNSTINSKITVQQDDNQRAFALELISKELADKFMIKSVANKTNDFLKQAQWYIEAEKLSLSDLGKLIDKSYLPNALVDAQLWFSSQKGNVIKLIGRAKLNKVETNENNGISGLAELTYRGDKHQWQAELSIKDIQTEFISQDKIIIQIYRKDSFIYLNADVLDIHLLKAITQVANISNEEFDNLSLNGKLTDVTIKYDVELRRIIDASVQFQQLDFEAEFSKLTGLSGSIHLDDDQIRLMIDSDLGTAEFPGYTRGKVQWDKLLLTAQTSMQDEDLDIKINSLWCDCKDFIIDGAARIAYDEQLLLDLTFAVYDAKVNQLYKYWPSRVWKSKTLNFLDQALVSGVVDKGMIIYHGLVKEAPFTDNQGVFLTKSFLKNATVKYHKDWPTLNNYDAVVDTVNRSLFVHSNNGNVLAAKVGKVYAVIENFKVPTLHINIDAAGRDNFLIDFLKQSPMKKGLEVLKEDIKISGSQKIIVNLDMPLNKPHVKVEPKGRIDFQGADFQMGQFQLQDLNGVVAFKGFSLSLKELKSKFLNQKAIVSGEILNEPSKNASIDIAINGDYDVKNFESILGFNLPAQGSSPWQFSVSNKNTKTVAFTATSDLTGIQLDMPEPFAKTTEQLAPFSISCILPCVDSGWDMAFDNKLATSFKLDANTSEFQLNKLIFGNPKDNLNNEFGGQIDVLDVDKWISVFAKNKSSGSKQEIPFKQMSIHVNKLIFMARELLDVRVEISTDDDGFIFNVDATAIKGKIIIAKDIDRKGIIIQLEKLHWQEPQNETIQQAVSQVSSNYPALHVWIGDFIYDGIPLGESSIEVRPVIEGIRVEKFNTESEFLSLNINGIWLRNSGTNGLSLFNIIMTSKDIAKFLANLGFQAPISEAKTIIGMQVQWDDFPSQFEIKNISGKMRIEIGEGEVVDAKPGVGRVLGLFSLTNLPRRLILDFKDVFGKGLHFQSMQGDFSIENGEAYTESFVIDSSSAEITLTGKTGLANQDYDQIVVVTPRVGRVLPTIGAITGGAVGAAAGFLVQGMFYKGLKGIGKIIYKVTGSWDNPVIELIETKSKIDEK